MSRSNPSASDENRKPRSRTSSQSSHYHAQHHHHHHTSSRSSPSPQSSVSKRFSGHSQIVNPSPLKMVTTQTTSAHHQHDMSYYYLPSEVELTGQGWMTPIDIDDDDLMFGGKSLSAWYEEERTRAASPPEEERRGRQRVSLSTNGLVAGVAVLDADMGLGAAATRSLTQPPSPPPASSYPACPSQVRWRAEEALNWLGRRGNKSRRRTLQHILITLEIPRHFFTLSISVTALFPAWPCFSHLIDLRISPPHLHYI